MRVELQLILCVGYIFYYIWRRFIKDKLEINLLDLSVDIKIYIYFLLILNSLLLINTCYMRYKEYRKEEIKANKFMRIAFYPFIFIKDCLHELHHLLCDRSRLFNDFLLILLNKLFVYVYKDNMFRKFDICVRIYLRLYYIPKMILLLCITIEVFIYNKVYCTFYCLSLLFIPIFISLIEYCLFYYSNFNLNLYLKYYKVTVNELENTISFTAYADKQKENPYTND